MTVAILDVGVGHSPGLRDENIVRVDLTEPMAGEIAVSNVHATAVASILAGNVKDMEGVSPAARVLSIRVLKEDGCGDSFTLAKGITEAVQREAKIINLCLGSRGDSPLVRQAVDYAVRKGVIVVAAVGNDSADSVSYPARYDGVLGVTAVDAGGRHPGFANLGPEVDVSAPGLEVWAPYSDSQAISMSGTSASVPFVTGALACLLSREPELKAEDAVNLLLRYSDDIGAPGRDPEYGSGILDIQRVLNRDVGGIHDVAVADNHLSSPEPVDGELSLVVSVQNRGTEQLSGAQLTVRIDGQTETIDCPEMNVGETVSHRFTIRIDEGKLSGGIKVVSTIETIGVNDDNPWNNERETVFTAMPKDAHR